MSKDKKRNSQPVVPGVAVTPDAVPVVDNVPPPVPVPVPSTAVVPGPVPPPTPKLMDVDKMALDLAKERRQTALAEAKTALAKNENAELAFKYIVLQLYMKYGLTSNDAISENGDIVIGGAAQVAQQSQGQ
jgi:hypothetical protein